MATKLDLSGSPTFNSLMENASSLTHPIALRKAQDRKSCVAFCTFAGMAPLSFLLDHPPMKPFPKEEHH